MITMNIMAMRDEVVVAACDTELLGRVFKEGKKRLDVSKDFYGKRQVDRAEFIETLKGATIANLTGETTVTWAIEAGFVDRSCVIRISGVPHAQLCRML